LRFTKNLLGDKTMNRRKLLMATLVLGVLAALAFTGCPQEENYTPPKEGVLTVTGADDGVSYEAEVYKYTKAVTDAEALNTVISRLSAIGTGIGMAVDGTMEIALQTPDGAAFTSDGEFLVVLKETENASVLVKYMASVPFTSGRAALEYSAMKTGTSSYTVTFFVDGVSNKVVEVPRGGKVEMPDLDTKAGYTFDGWYRNAEGTGAAWDFDTDTVKEDITLYGTWTAKPSYLTLTGGTTVEFSVDDLPALCSGAGADASITVNGQRIVKNTIKGALFSPLFADVTELPGNFCRSFTNLTELDLSGFTGLTSIGHYFLSGCTSFNQPLTLPSSIRSIGNNFLSGYPTAITFNNTLTLPEGLTSIGDALLSDNPNFNQPLTIPASVTYIGSHFLVNCDSLTSAITINCPATAFNPREYSDFMFSAKTDNAASYTTGIRIAGPYTADIMQRFPNGTASGQYRKLIAAP
jgi:uncharacterized repeat protein (TIGR02543 family)